VRPVTIARNYAEALVSLAGEAGELEAWGELIDGTAAAFGTPAIEAVLMSPRVTKEQKVTIVTEALGDAPHHFVLFLAAVIRRGRAMLLGKIADEYRGLVDLRMNRVRAGVTTARPVDEAARQAIVAKLTAAIGKEVIAGFTTDPALLGGVMVRIGDRVYDGSVRKKLGTLRQKLLIG
jgi:F-type H+-transporting ATPase subunit delta